MRIHIIGGHGSGKTTLAGTNRHRGFFKRLSQGKETK